MSWKMLEPNCGAGWHPASRMVFGSAGGAGDSGSPIFLASQERSEETRSSETVHNSRRRFRCVSADFVYEPPEICGLTSSRTAPVWLAAARLQFPPLFRCENQAEREQHAGIGLFKFGARTGDAVDLREDHGLGRMVRGEKRLKRRFFLLQGRAQVDQAEPVLLVYLLEPFLLIVGQSQPAHGHRIGPPLAREHIGRPAVVTGP